MTHREPRAQLDVEIIDRRAWLRCSGTGLALGLAGAGGVGRWAFGQDREVLPKHITAETMRVVIRGLDHLASTQADDGAWITGGGQAYPSP